jgi:hypothetical protein
MVYILRGGTSTLSNVEDASKMGAIVDERGYSVNFIAHFRVGVHSSPRPATSRSAPTNAAPVPSVAATPPVRLWAEVITASNEPAGELAPDCVRGRGGAGAADELSADGKRSPGSSAGTSSASLIRSL